MKFKSSVLTQASGSVGGITYSHNRGGMYQRARATPVNRKTARQMTVRNAMNLAHTAWLSLTAGVKSQWNAYASGTPVKDALGNNIYLTGRAMFIRQYVLANQASMTQKTTAPVSTGLCNLTGPTFALHGTSCTVTYTNGDGWRTASGFLSVFVSPPKSVGVNYYDGPYEFAGKITAAVSSPTTVVSPYTYSAGQRGFVRVIAVDNTRRLSEPFRGSCTST
jgi:hypothetical protein